jgi:hypothetical protein
MNRARYTDGLRRCRTCGEVRPRDGFPRAGGRVCRACKAAYNRAWYASHRDRWALYGARYRARHAGDAEWRERRRLVFRLWYERHREAHLPRQRAAYAAHRERHLAGCRRYYRKNRERVRARVRAYYAAHRRRLRAEARAKYDRLRANGGRATLRGGPSPAALSRFAPRSRPDREETGT